MKTLKLWMCLFFALVAANFVAAAPPTNDAKLNASLERVGNTVVSSTYPWKYSILTTFFWIGNNRNSYTTTVNYDSAWDRSWHENYGGDDDPVNRKGYRPRGFFPGLNPFYVALPFNDVAFPEKASRLVPWYKKKYVGRFQSTCKGRWVAVHFRGRFCFATWEDVGPFRADNAEYVFGNSKPNTPTGAGLDVSPAVRDYLGLTGKDQCDWRFIEDNEVPSGPWIEYGEKALILSLLRDRKKEGRALPIGAKEFKPDT
jgi:hypothetical protein